MADKPINILIREDQKKFLDEVFRWGEVSVFFRTFLDDLQELSNEDPALARKIAISYLKGGITFKTLIGAEDAETNRDKSTVPVATSEPEVSSSDGSSG